MNYIRAYCQHSPDEETDDNSPIRWIASTEGVKRDGLELKKEDWDLENFRKHPVVLFAHDYMGRNLPIGIAVPGFEGRDLIMDVTYDNEDEFAMSIRRKAIKGMMAGSVGWDNVQVGKGKVKHELLEFSMVPVPADPASLPVRQMRAWQDLNNLLADALAHTEYYEPERERPFPNHHACRLRNPGDFQDGSFVTTQREHEGKKYNVIQGKLEGETELTDQAFRYPKDTWTVDSARSHCSSHDGKSFEPASERSLLNLSEVDVWDGVASAMLALYQPSSTIEDEVRQALYIVLERAYRKLGKTAPEFLSSEEVKALSDTELRGLFLEDELIRAGAVLSARNRGDLEQAITLIQGVIDRAAKEEKEPARNEQENQTREAIYSIHELFKEFKNG